MASFSMIPNGFSNLPPRSTPKPIPDRIFQNGINSDASSDSINGVWDYSTMTNASRQVITGSYNASALINIDVEPLLELVEDIVKEKGRQEKSPKFNSQELQQRTVIPGLSQVIHKITCEISYDCPEKGSTADERAKSLLNLLSNYSPDAQIVLVLTAFAIRYGDFMVTVNQYTTKSVIFVDSLLLLKQITGTMENENTLQKEIKNIKDIMKTLLSNAYYIHELKGFCSWTNIASEIRITDIIYWMMRTVIYCGSTVSNLCNGYISSLYERSELTASVEKISYYYEQLTTRVTVYRKREVEARVTKHYQELLGLLQFPPACNIDILQYFISSIIDRNIVYNPVTKVSTTLQLFRDKKILILYSNYAIETFQTELSVLEAFTNNTHSKFGYEIVWVPIVDQNSAKIDEIRYNEIISRMPWHTLAYNAVLEVNSGLIHLLRKDWGFTGKPILVVLDERGQVVRQNALLMLHLYDSEAFPFTQEHEIQLLTKISKGMQFLLAQIDTKVSQWIKSRDRYVCLYGGDNIEWCQGMVQLLKSVTEASNIKVDTAYVGRNTHHQELVEATLKSFKAAKLGHNFDYSHSIEFWERVQKCILHFSTHVSSEVSQDFVSWASSLLTFEKSRESWVVIGNADHIVVFRGGVFINGLNAISSDLEQWKQKVSTVGFLVALSEWLKDHKINGEKHCHELEIVGNPALIKKNMLCPTCNESMQVVTLDRCCK